MEKYLLKNYFDIQQKILKVLGISLTTDLSAKEKYSFYLVYTVMMTYSLLVVPEFFYPKDFNDLVNDLMFATCYAVGK